jgi:hypothetical protein
MYTLDLHEPLLSQLHLPNPMGTSRILLLKIRYRVSCMSHALVVLHSRQVTCLELYGQCNNTDGVLRETRQGAHFRP